MVMREKPEESSTQRATAGGLLGTSITLPNSDVLVLNVTERRVIVRIYPTCVLGILAIGPVAQPRGAYIRPPSTFYSKANTSKVYFEPMKRLLVVANCSLPASRSHNNATRHGIMITSATSRS
jgi:hypothetical protein